MLQGIFFDLTVIFVVIAVLAFIAKFFKLPLIPVYIIAGILLVPLAKLVTGFSLISDADLITNMSQFGIVFLLFIAGLELDIKRLKHVSSVSTVGGSILFVILFLLGMGVSSLIGFNFISSIYMGLIFSFSSTMIVVKVLADKNELDSLHGKISIGLLLVQDFFAIIAFLLLTSYGNFDPVKLLILISSLVGLIAIAFLLSRYVLPRIFSFAAEFQEMLFISSIAICLLFAMLFGIFVSPQALGIGAYLAGLALANLPYNLEIISRISPLKDFFSMIFFISLGMSLPLVNFSAAVVPSIIFLVLVLIAKPLITFFMVYLFGYTSRVSFMSALTQSQVSEFGLILVFFGLASGHVSEDFFASVVVMAIVSLSLFSYVFEHKNDVFLKIRKFLPKGSDKCDLNNMPKKFKKKFVLLAGYDRIGYSILEVLKKMKEITVVVDFNPEVIHTLMEEKINCVYGDISDSEFLKHLHLNECKLVISTVPDKQANLLIMQKLKQVNSKALCFLTTETVLDALELYDEGADYVIVPRHLSGKHLSIMVKKSKFDSEIILKNKLEHLNELLKRTKHATRHR